MTGHDEVRLVTEEMSEQGRRLYDRDGDVATVLTAIGQHRQLAALVEDHRKIPCLAQQMVMALNARLVSLIAEVFTKEVDGDEPHPTKAGDLIEMAEHDPTIETAVLVTTISTDHPTWLTQRSIARLDTHGRRKWVTDVHDDGDGQVLTYLQWAAANPLEGGPLDVDELHDFAAWLQESDLTPCACVVDPDHG